MTSKLHFAFFTSVLIGLLGGGAPAAQLADEADLRVLSSMQDAYGVSARIGKEKAKKPHDPVTILINESTTAKHEATMDLEKEASISSTLNKWFTLKVDKEGNIVANPRTGLQKPEIDFTAEREHEGEGETERSQTLRGRVTGEVLEVKPNGQLVVVGRKTITINAERQTIELTGRVDPRHLSSDSSVDANHIIDLTIRFTGKGPVTQATRRGWFAKILDIVSPF